MPFSCLTVWELTKSTTAAGIAGALILFGKFLGHFTNPKDIIVSYILVGSCNYIPIEYIGIAGHKPLYSGIQ